MIALLVATAWGVGIADVPNPRPAGGWVSDVADVLGADDELRLNGIIGDVNRATGAEIGLVTVQDVDTTPKQFATDLLNAWGIGRKGADDGLLILVVVGDHRMEMETGYGLEGRLTDGWLGALQAQRIVPAFKRGEYGPGLIDGVSQIAGKLGVPVAGPGGDPTAAPLPYSYTPEPTPAYSPSEGVTGPVGQPWGLIGAAVGGAGVAGTLAMGVLWWRKRERTCPTCQIAMPMLDEVDDDDHLNVGERKEEELGSVDHQIHICPKCGYMRHFQSVAWFSGYGRCSGCGVRAEQSQSTTLVQATHAHGGSARVTTNCMHCARTTSRVVRTPQLVTTSVSTHRSSGGGHSSGGGSWGGGRSGGGGAGSSW